MTFCTYETTGLIEVGSIVKKNGSSVVLYDNASDAVLVGVVTRSYSNEESTQYYAEVHIGGGYTEAILGGSWDGTFNYLTILNNTVIPTNDTTNIHGYLINDIIPVPRTAGDLVPIYWRGAY
jgi:hypothetical protein